MGTKARTPLLPRAGNGCSGLTRLGEPKNLEVQDQLKSQCLPTALCWLPTHTGKEKFLFVEMNMVFWPCCPGVAIPPSARGTGSITPEGWKVGGWSPISLQTGPTVLGALK